MDVFYVKEPNSWLASQAGRAPNSKGSKQLLLGQRLHVDLSTETNGWVAASTAPNKNDQTQSGFIQRELLSETQILKVFYTDVGQGDATLGGKSSRRQNSCAARVSGFCTCIRSSGISPVCPLADDPAGNMLHRA